ncbi:putative S-adenosylmethionine-dependent methyltransferase [Corynebacterium glaucum]|uniref:Putative S-adenosylmethionine-dependent methyltransferase n=3 Tax=Corynebacterium glaucum TaxID=187491 RepID=A0A1Q2HTA0_9CORY|nr:putative S-adenosylmethionine-dependent methyltransferase [Corynebacterium glaucum]WJZ06589.1 putative S-adenosylmethionine-dependent methyltransferase [Corynebacterium glaucum]
MYDVIKQAYAKRAPEYVEALGSIQDMSPQDIVLISEWGRMVSGPVLDAGSGPGHWTDLLRTLDCEVVGLDMVSEFIGIAQNRFPSTNFVLGELSEIPFKSSSLGGILAWYSLIHLRPDDWALVLSEFSRTLKPDGSLLLGAFLGEQGAPFEHAITTAYYWSEIELLKQLESAGFKAISVHSRHTDGIRPHLDVLAQRC